MFWLTTDETIFPAWRNDVVNKIIAENARCNEERRGYRKPINCAICVGTFLGS